MPQKNVVTAFCVLALAEIIFVFFAWQVNKTKTEEKVLTAAESIAISLNSEEIKHLHASPDDEGTQAYISVKRRLVDLKRHYKDISFAYLYALKNGKVFFMVDSEPPTSKGYSPPGQEYTEARSEDKMPFENGKPLVTPPAADRWGRWRSALVPIKDYDTGEITAVLGLDYPADTFFNSAEYETLQVGAISLFIFIILLFLYFLYDQNRRLETERSKAIIAGEKIKNAEEQYRLLVMEMRQGLALYEIIYDGSGNGKPADYRYISVNDGYERITGLRRSDIIGRMRSEVFSKSDDDFVRNCNQAALTGISRQFEHYIPKLDKHYVATAYSPKAGQLAVIIDDITEKKRIERALKENERYLRAVVETAQDGFFVIDASGKITDVNDAYCLMTGYSRTELLSMTIGEIDTNMESVTSRVKRVSESGAELFEASHIRKDGTSFNVEISATLLRTGGHAIACFCRDISVRKQMEQSIREKNVLLRGLFDNLPEALVVCEVAGDGCSASDYVVREYNNTFLALEHIKGRDVFGKLLYELFPDISSNELAQLFRRVWKSGVPAISSPLRVINSDGYKWFEVRVFRLETGEVVAMADDVTERMRMQMEIFNEKERLKTTLLSIGDGVISTDGMSAVKIMNKVAENLTGWTQDEAQGRPIEEIFNAVDEETGEKYGNPVGEAIRSKKITFFTDRVLLISKDGTVRPVEDSAAPIADEDGNISGAVLVFRDVTEKKEKQSKIEYLSYHDDLTGLYNRSFFNDALKKLDTKESLPLTILMGDVNSLKLINDSFGHSMGDDLLKSAAKAISQALGPKGIAARVGGDEFVVLMPKTDLSAAEDMVKRIKSFLKSQKIASLDVSISFGYCTKRSEDESIQAIMKTAEDSMYSNKLYENSHMGGKTINIILKTLHEKNKREEEHSKRVSELCEAIGRALGMSDHKVNELKTVGLLHDIGKIAIDEKILNKPGLLSTCEMNEVKRHTEIGYRILNTVSEMSGIADYVLSHHERWDGNGYPRGLQGESIPLEARIIAVADAYDAMVSYRTYKASLSHEAALAELEKSKGTQFDPRLVDVFINEVFKGDRI
jgi:diguanylate cyclase (GGDEF)-like protein/PAS domain S-box-containing protein/putative nucleotidyltransferase with HDIG domain